jgi:glycosyltransferase involved in cell wall biosynthesis
MRLAIYADYAYRRAEGRLWAEMPVALFLAAMDAHFASVTLVGRLEPQARRWKHEVPSGVGFAPLPHYPALSRPLGVLRATAGSLVRFWRVLGGVDAVWLFGPHPLVPLFCACAAIRRRRVVLGVRQDYPAYVRARHPRRRALHLAAWVLEGGNRLLARRCRTVVVGPDLASRYRQARRVLDITVSLVPARDLAGPQVAAARRWDGELRALSVGRLDAEKNPLLLADVLATLLRRDPRWRMIVCGEGPLRDPLHERLLRLGVGARAELRGYVPVDGGLRALYRTSHALVHCSWTEGVPQVLNEAFAARLPVVATAVGGVPDAVGDAAVLVPPGDAEAAARALADIAADSALRDRLTEAAARRARENSLESLTRRVAQFIASD